MYPDAMIPLSHTHTHTYRYQTVYAAADKAGSVAAPTAGLHFTDDILAALAHKGITATRMALHVSAGTFKPVAVDCISQHPM